MKNEFFVSFLWSVLNRIITFFNKIKGSQNMGAHSSHLNTHSSFSLDDWQEIPLSPYTDIKDPSYGSNFRVYSNKLNPSSQIEHYDLFFNSYQEYLEYREVTYWRTGGRFLVHAKHIRQPKKHQICSTFEHSSVYIERIPIRLVEIQDISIEQAFQGFDKLYDKYGFFQIEPQMIGFTKEGFVRVWVNKNLSRHYPQNIYVQYKYRTYDYFIKNLIQMIEQLIDFQNRPTITSYLEHQYRQEPYRELSSMLEKYSKEYQILVPRFLTSIKNICQRNREKKKTIDWLEKEKNKNQVNKHLSRKNKTTTLQQSNRADKVAVSQSPRRSFPPLEELQFNRKSVTIAPATDRYMSVTSRTPTVRFHYRNITLPSSSKVASKETLSCAQHSSTTLNSTKRINSSDSLYCFYKVKRSKSKLQRWEIDPQIAADLAKLDPIQQ